MELYNVNFLIRTSCLGYVVLQAHNFTAAVVSCCCTLLHSCTACKELLPWWNCLL